MKHGAQFDQMEASEELKQNLVVKCTRKGIKNMPLLKRQ
jgi:hypothetical protein